MAKDNLAVYTDTSVVSHYAAATDLLPPERYLFERFLRPGLSVLDIGVGGGRTTAYLAKDARRYVGVDYSDAMIGACRKRYPDLEFAVADASDLSRFGDGEFDLAVFSFNGIDYLPDDASRRRALSEMRRVTKGDGKLIISSHSARQLVVLPVLDGAGPARIAWRLLRAIARSIVQSGRALTNAYFWRGHGYMRDPVHGGLHSHVSSLASIAEDCAAVGLEIEEAVGAFHPRQVPEWANNWTTYVLRRSDAG